MEIILYIILLVCGTAFVLLFGLLLLSAAVFTSRRIWMPVACAGKAETGMLHWRRGPSMYSNEFVAPDGTALSPKKYQSYVTRGESMCLCGIHEGAVLFVRKDYCFDEQRITFPKILLLKRDKWGWKNWKDIVLMWLGLKPSYKVRRAWALYRVGEDDVDAILEQIREDATFGFLESRPEFMGWDAMKNNFKNVKLGKYKTKYSGCEKDADANHLAVISTTLHKNIMFSIHPVRVIEGEVECYYNTSDVNEPMGDNPLQGGNKDEYVCQVG